MIQMASVYNRGGHRSLKKSMELSKRSWIFNQLLFLRTYLLYHYKSYTD